VVKSFIKYCAKFTLDENVIIDLWEHTHDSTAHLLPLSHNIISSALSSQQTSDPRTFFVSCFSPEVTADNAEQTIKQKVSILLTHSHTELIYW
jgi:hypothetical protein